jgi:branched-chain amino acid transport system substrate-binding protein
MSRLCSISDRIKTLTLFLGAAAVASAWPWSTDEVKIGFVAQLTGADSYVGQAAKLALEDHVADLNAKGGISGKKVKLIVYDSRCEATEAVAATKRLIDQDHVAGVVGPEWSAAAIPLGPIAEAGKVPVLATTASNIKVTLNDNGSVKPWIFRTCFIDPYQGTALANYAFRDLKKRKAAFIYDVGSAYSAGILQFFEAEFTRLGGKMVAKEGYQTNDTEFRAQLSKVAQAQPDCLVVPTSTYRDIALIGKQAEALGLKFQLLGVDGWVADELLTMAGKELEGSVLTSGLSTEDAQFADYNAKFLAKHKMKCQIYAYYALDAIMALEHGIKVSLDTTKKVDTGVIRETLENMKDVPVFTSSLTYEAKTHNPHNKPIVVMTIKNSKWQTVKTYKPE